MNDVITAILLFMPAGISNMSPVIANKLPFINKWNTPLDFGLKWRGERILGDNKRWRGIVFGAILGSVTAIIVAELDSSVYITVSPIYAGTILGIGALTGDAVESFFKRRFGHKPGESWFPFDQTDYIVGGLIAIYPFQQLSIWTISIIFIAYFGLHIAAAFVGFKLGLKDKPI